MGLVALLIALWSLARATALGAPGQIVLPLAVLTAGPVIQQATNGVETGWAMAAAIGLLAAGVAKRSLAAAALSGLLPWLRPDLTPMAGLLLGAALWKRPAHQIVQSLLMAALVFGPWPLWLHAETGAWLPNSMAAKAAFFAESCQPLMTKIATVTHAMGAWLVLFLPASLVGFARWTRSSTGLAGLVSILVVLTGYVTFLPGALWHNEQRYLYAIIVPWLAFGFADALRDHRSIWRIGVPTVLVASIFLYPMKWIRWPDDPGDRLAAATWMRDNVDPRAPILVHDAGVFAVLTENPLIDIVGLKTHSSYQAHRLYTKATCGADRVRAVAGIARATAAQYLVVTSDWDRLFGLTDGLRRDGFDVTEIRPNPSGASVYHVYRIDRRASQ